MFSNVFNATFEMELQKLIYQAKQGFLSWYWLIVKCWKQFRFLMDILTSNSAESQIDFDLGTPQLIPTEKMLQIITSKDSSTNTIEEGKEIFVIQSLKDNINGLKNQLKDKEKK